MSAVVAPAPKGGWGLKLVVPAAIEQGPRTRRCTWISETCWRGKCKKERAAMLETSGAVVNTGRRLTGT